jgi:2-polyprenyl-3-methyl-5-hydroxy-6-metoxy-1,4-benzoquinol methylase
LEILCGNGKEFGKYQRSNIKSYTGYDIDERILNEAEKTYKSRNNCTFEANFVNKLEDIEKIYDVVTSFGSIDMYFNSENNARVLFQNISKLIKEQGKKMN